MLARLRIAWVRVRDSLWFLPGVLTLCAAVAAVTITAAERRSYVPARLTDSWAFGGGVEGARGVLNAIAGGLITVTGVVFSVTIVALQLASSQFTPRILRNFTADRANQLVLGVFIATFTYTLLVLRTVQSAQDEQEPFVPRVAVTLAVALVMVSIGFLIFFINHAASSIQVSTILDRVAEQTRRNVERLFPEPVGDADPEHPPDPRPSEAPSAPVAAARAGYLQSVDGRALFRLGRERSLVVAMVPHVGDFLLPGQALAQVWPPEGVDEEVRAAVRKAFVMGPQRTPDQDVEFGIVEIADIAVKALSPGINDPTTAMHCVDRLGEILLALGTRRALRAERVEGRLHYIARPTTFARALGLAFGQIRHFGSGNPAVVKRIADTLTGIAPLLPEAHRATVAAELDRLLHAARHDLDDPAEVAGVEAALARMRGGGPAA